MYLSSPCFYIRFRASAISPAMWNDTLIIYRISVPSNRNLSKLILKIGLDYSSKSPYNRIVSHFKWLKLNFISR